jgi:hypothetical protein
MTTAALPSAAARRGWLGHPCGAALSKPRPSRRNPWNASRDVAGRRQKAETGKSKLEIRKSKIETGKPKFESRKLKLENGRVGF